MYGNRQVTFYRSGGALAREIKYNSTRGVNPLSLAEVALQSIKAEQFAADKIKVTLEFKDNASGRSKKFTEVYVLANGSFNKILKDCRGGIGTAVLAGILCAAVCLHAAAYWVRQEAEENSRRILRRQLQFAVQALAKAGFEYGSMPEGGINLPPQKLYPGKLHA
mgnify:CR=1 FL=1